MDEKFTPTDSGRSARFNGISTFMRAKHLTLGEIENAEIAIVGVPFDLGTFYRAGSRQGPSAIREASRVLKKHDGHSGIAPFEAASICDVGDVEINPVRFDESLASITKFIHSLVKRGIRPASIGGDHTITLPILRAFGNSEISLVHFDAHPDTADEVLGTKINHGTPLRRLVEEKLVNPHHSVQIGLRGSMNTQDDYKWAKSVGIRVITMDEYELIGRQSVINEIRLLVGDRQAYVTFDIDALDASQVPGTGVPEPGGFSMRDALVMIRELRGLSICGFDVCEVSPSFDSTGLTALNAAHIIRGLLSVMAEDIFSRNRMNIRSELPLA